MSNSSAKDEFFETMLYLLTSARVCIDEPKRYGSFRLFQAYRKLLELVIKHNLAKDMSQIKNALDEIEKNRKLISSSSCVESKEYTQLLDKLIEIMVGGL